MEKKGNICLSSLPIYMQNSVCYKLIYLIGWGCGRKVGLNTTGKD